MKRILFFLICLAFVIPSTYARAQPQESYPKKMVKIILPFEAGGSTDLLARSLADRLSTIWNQPVVVQNRAGASGTIGATHVARAEADGYTLLIGTATTQELAPMLYPNVSYDPDKDFVAISELVAAPQVLVVNANLPIRSLKEFVDYCKKNPEEFTHGGNRGSAAHMTMELFSAQAGIKTFHIPYKGSAPSMIDLLGGRLSGGFDVVMTTLPQLKTGKLRALAVTTPARIPFLPDVPTVAESGYPDFEASVWFGLFAPSKTPSDVVAKISEDTLRVLQEPEFKKQLEATGFMIVGSRPKEFAERISIESTKWKKVIQDNNLQIQ